MWSWPVILVLLATLARVGDFQQQIESPNSNSGDDDYLPPELGRGVGSINDRRQNDQQDQGGRSRYPDRRQSYNSQYDPGSVFRQTPPNQTPARGQGFDDRDRDRDRQRQRQRGRPQDHRDHDHDHDHGGSGQDRRGGGGGFQQQPQSPAFNYDPYPTSNFSRSNVIVTRRTTTTAKPRTTTRTTARPGAKPTRDPFNDPNRYRVPQSRQQHDQVRFVNGRPYREPPNIQDRYGNRYDPRFHSIPGEYDPENDPRFSDPRYQDPRNVPKYNSNRHRVPTDRYDSKYRYYERFPDRQRDRIRDPNYDPRWDPDDPPVPGVLGGWLPELQGECRPGCENLPRDVTVNTNYGRVNGFIVYLYDGPRVPEFDRPGVANVDKVKKTVSVFLGIPYAQAPIGEARLMPPRPHRGWQSYDAVDWAPVCPQPVRYVGATKNAPHMDEDCLYLNVYTPTVDSGQSQLFPVMFYIHDGEFAHGSGNEFPGHQLAANGQVVVVTVNYRLGALGFLSTGDHHSPGNYGLLDMAMAIKWVYDNVISFQGDRDRITVFGPGAGAASAGLLAVMPKTKSMVRRVIAISGSPLADWAAINDKFRAMNTSLVYGERIGCTIDNSWKLVDCVRRGRSFAELTNVEFKPEIGTWPWAPVVQKNISVPDDEWYEEWTKDDFMALPERADVLYENQQYNPKLQYLTGVARDDAAYMIYENKTLAPKYDIGWPFFDMMVRDHIMQYNYTLNPEGIFGAIKYMYTYYPDPNNKSHIREEFINFYSDYFYRAPQDNIVKTLVRNRVDTYMYVQNTTVEALKLPWWRQITHNLEHYFLSGAPFMDPVFFPEDQQVSRRLWTEGDRNMSEFFIYAMANFSWYGNPTPKTILGVHWDMAKQGEILQYLAVNTTENSTTLWNYRQRECAFWTEYLPTVIGYITPTYPPTTEFWWEPDSPLQIGFWSMASLTLVLLVFVVIFCLLWRNAKRQAKDRYFDGGGSLKDYPSTYHMDNFSNLGSNIQSNKTDITHDHHASARAASAMDPLMTGTLQSHLSSQPTTMLMGQNLANVPVIQQQQQQTAQQLPSITPAGIMSQQPPSMVMTSSASMGLLSAPYVGGQPVGIVQGTGPASAVGMPTVGVGYPNQPLPPVPTALPSTVVGNGVGVGGMRRNQSTDSLGQLSSSGRGTGPNDSSTDNSNSGRPITPVMSNSRPTTPPAVPQPMGLPSRAKLVPGRMSKPGPGNERRRELSMTAV